MLTSCNDYNPHAATIMRALHDARIKYCMMFSLAPDDVLSRSGGFSYTVITQLDWPQIAKDASCELGLRRQVVHFRVSQRIRLIFGQELIPRGPEL